VHFDVLIVGAGISGIDAAYHLQAKCPNKSYAILEGREAIGGTWDLFKYPGIRSDSDMLTLGFPFRPWLGAKTIADGPAILEYVRETAAHYGIDKHIRFGERVTRAEWANDTWTITTSKDQYTASFLFLCSGYYDYNTGYTPDFPGLSSYKGRLIHPQFWPDDLDYAGKRVVVIGSGATAVTLAPALTDKAAHVTMLQRSPTYIASVPARDKATAWLREKLPGSLGSRVARWKNVGLGMAFYQFCRKFPNASSKFLVKQVDKALGGATDVKEHFTPSYKPWDQRLCLVPDADLFTAIKGGKLDVVTDHIEAFTESGITLKSGKTLEADIVVSATGLVLKVFGGIELVVDGEKVDPPTRMLYRGMMVTGVPNFAFSVGYTNASWTLKCDLTSQYVCRLLSFMDKKGFTRVAPRRDPDVAEIPLLDFTSGYVQRAIAKFPRQGEKLPWKLYQNYALDVYLIRYARLDDPALDLT
jgi:cation diffusion facilitator CzcD-associated flavoprotein CzcO